MIATNTSRSNEQTGRKKQAAQEYEQQAERLGFKSSQDGGIEHGALEAKFVTAQDPIVETANGARLPAVPTDEALKLNRLKDEMEGRDPSERPPLVAGSREAKDGTVHGAQPSSSSPEADDEDENGSTLRHSSPPMVTSPLFPPLPMYGPPSFLRTIQCYFFRLLAAMLSFCFLMVLLLGSAFTSIPLMFRHIWIRLNFQDPDARRPFYHEETRRKQARKEAANAWQTQPKGASRSLSTSDASDNGHPQDDEHPPLAGGPDPLLCDAAYYARRVGLNMEEFDVQTEDGFTIRLWHVYDPYDQSPARPDARRQRSASIFRKGFAAQGRANGTSGHQHRDGQRRYPVLLMPGLLQSGGAYCCNDDDSLAFFLTKSGFDVWIGNNRCGFEPKHNLLEYGDPRMWAWNIRQMGVLDLPAFISRVLSETGFEKLGLVCHSQGTTETFVALAKEQRPDIGNKISVFCALAPAVYAGSLIRKIHFKFMKLINPAMFRLIFGIHAFIPFMMTMHAWLPARLYGAMGYRIFSFMFDWSDDRWERDIRNRMFQFAPTYVSAESMRWWLGRECFAKQKCILATRSEGELEDEEDEEEDLHMSRAPNAQGQTEIPCLHERHHHAEHGKHAWYDENAPPFAFWIAGSDDLVDGNRLLRRFNRGREPHVNLVHQKVIPEYEHLDVLWAMDSIDKVGKEVKDVLWKTAPSHDRGICRVPSGCAEPAS
ncbi:MAG: hypothetical protein M1828_005519 [Chrysothrix sp. TS-e1954]|nr:MAG: hypothetical protein M1828_005519 [Chrysothrix sp. TS-e1954]